jgi:hypothetical protein
MNVYVYIYMYIYIYIYMCVFVCSWVQVPEKLSVRFLTRPANFKDVSTVFELDNVAAAHNDDNV